MCSPPQRTTLGACTSHPDVARTYLEIFFKEGKDMKRILTALLLIAALAGPAFGQYPIISRMEFSRTRLTSSSAHPSTLLIMTATASTQPMATTVLSQEKQLLGRIPSRLVRHQYLRVTLDTIRLLQRSLSLGSVQAPCSDTGIRSQATSLQAA